MDELGAPFGVTVDFQTVEDKSVTLRERDSMTQIRMPLVDVAPLVARLVTEETTWQVKLGRLLRMRTTSNLLCLVRSPVNDVSQLLMATYALSLLRAFAWPRGCCWFFWLGSCLGSCVQ